MSPYEPIRGRVEIADGARDSAAEAHRDRAAAKKGLPPVDPGKPDDAWWIVCNPDEFPPATVRRAASTNEAAAAAGIGAGSR